MTYITKKKISAWFEASLVRALRTAAQTALALIPMGVTIQDVGWAWVIGSAALAAVLSMLTSVAGLPEVEDGERLSEMIAGDERDDA